MTNITVKYLEIEANGHANAQRINDYDLVCCSVSTLLGTLGNALLDMYYDGFMVSPPAIEQRSGYVHIKAEPKTSKKEIVERVFNSFVLGLTILSEQYPKNIKIDKGESFF